MTRFPSRTLMALAATALIVALAVLPASSQLMQLDRQWNTVAGLANAPGPTNGFIGQNRLSNAFALCGSYERTSTDLILIGTSRPFRTYNRTSKYLGTWFGAAQQAEANTNGPIAQASVSGGYGCTRFDPLNGEAPIIYYVTGDAAIRYVMNDVVYSVSLSGSLSFQDITVFNNRIYAVDLYSTSVYSCTISAINPSPQGCARVSLASVGIPQSPNNPQRGIAVTDDGIFIASGMALVWYSNPVSTTGTAAPIQSSSDLLFVDVRVVPNPGAGPSMLMAITRSSIYNITVTSPSTWELSVFAGADATSGQSGFDPTFDDFYRLHPVNLDEVYLTIPGMSIMRSLTLPPVGVNYTFIRRPFPIGFYKGESIMSELLALMDSNLNGVLDTTGVTVNSSTGLVDAEWWDTQFEVNVPQRVYDVTTTTPTVQGIHFDETLRRLEEYYNYTDEVIYTDFNVMPTCNRTQMNNVEHAIANLARQALVYSLIYTDPAMTITVNGNPNITAVKLLMPAPFGTAPGEPYNETTHPLIVDANISAYMVQIVTDAYTPDRVYTVEFTPSDEFPFKDLSEEQLQQIRWIIQRLVEVRLRQCAAQVGDPADGGQGDAMGSGGEGSDLIPGCTPKIGITNETYLTNVGKPGYTTDYTVFVPYTMNYTFDIAKCLDDMDKDDVKYWIGNSTALPKGAKCGTGCIVGIAVAAAVVAAVLIVLLVVFTSKRKRLATVVAPAATTAEPKFASTLDDDEDDEDDGVSIGSGRNPLQRV